MNIGCYLISKNEFNASQIPEELLVELCKALRNNGSEMVHFADSSILVDGIYIPAKGVKSSLMVIPKIDEE